MKGEYERDREREREREKGLVEYYCYLEWN